MTSTSRAAAPAHAGPAPQYRADIDGLRAVAVLGVVAYHFGLGVPGGYGGVDVFFVISGFLIAGIIRAELEAGTFSLANFYVRRIRRILPALAACLLVTTAFSALILFPTDFIMFGKSLRDVALSISNFYFMRLAVSYFGTGMAETPSLHTWSLGIEEQFYAVVPMLMLALFSFNRRFVVPVTVALAAMSFFISVRGVAYYPQQAFFSTAGRVWELFIGVLLAFGVVPHITKPITREIAAAVGLALIGFGYFSYTDATSFPGAAAIPFCLGAALILHSGSSEQPTAVARMLSMPLATGIGLISYSVYLWHWPLIALTRYRFPQWFAPESDDRIIIAIALFFVSLAIGFLSWRLIEQPFRRGGKSWPRAVVFAGGGATLAALIFVSHLVVTKPGLLQRWSPEIAQLTANRAGLQNPGLFGRAVAVPGEKLGAVYEVGAGDKPSSILLWGDSHALAMLPEFSASAKKANVRALAAPHEGCPPFLGISYPETDIGTVCRELNETSARVALQPEITTVVLVGRWTAVAAGVQSGQSGKPVFTGTGSDSSDAFSTAITQTVKSLLAHGKNVVIVGPVPELPFDLFAAMARHTAWGQPLPPEATRDDFLRRQAPILQLLSTLAHLPRVEVVYPHELLCGEVTCPYAKAGVPFYVDRDHLSPAGAAQLEPMFRNIFHSDHSVAAAVRISG